MLAQRRFERFQVDTFFVQRQANDAQSVVGKDAQREKIGRLLSKDDIARSGEERADEAKCSGRAGGDEEVVHVDRLLVLAAEEACQRLSEISVTLFVAIIQERGVLTVQALGGHSAA